MVTINLIYIVHVIFYLFISSNFPLFHNSYCLTFALLPVQTHRQYKTSCLLGKTFPQKTQHFTNSLNHFSNSKQSQISLLCKIIQSSISIAILLMENSHSSKSLHLSCKTFSLVLLLLYFLLFGSCTAIRTGTAMKLNERKGFQQRLPYQKLVFNFFPKGTVPPSGPSKRHNEVVDSTPHN